MRLSGRHALRASFISPEETALIKYQIEFVRRPAVVKSGLQRLCGHLESHRFLSDAGPFRNWIVGLISTGPTMVRRWAYKVLAHIGTKDDIPALSDRMRREEDAENLTWIMSAIFALSKAGTVIEFCRLTGAEYSEAMALAAILYGNDAIQRIGTNIPNIDIDIADPLTLKWCALLAGYGRAPPNLLHPHYENGELLGVLNSHSAEEVAEYSVWALWMSPEFTVQDLLIPQHELMARPENVRRWTNRLLAKDPEFLASNPDLFESLSCDDTPKAREGLALGIREAQIPGLQSQVVSWYGRETEGDIREILLEHMAISGAGDTDLFDLVRSEYDRANVGGGLQHRLRAAVSNRGGRLFQEFKAIDAKRVMSNSPFGLFGDNSIQSGTTNMTVNFNTNVSGNVGALTQAGGDIVAGDINAIQLVRQQDAAVGEALEQILALAGNRAILDQNQGNELTAAVNNAARVPTPENKGKLLEYLKVLASVATISSAAVKIPELIETISSWI